MEEEPEETILEKMHDSGVGTSDPNIATDDPPTIQEADPNDDRPIEV
jgi:hypothetical protein